MNTKYSIGNLEKNILSINNNLKIRNIDLVNDIQINNNIKNILLSLKITKNRFEIFGNINTNLLENIKPKENIKVIINKKSNNIDTDYFGEDNTGLWIYNTSSNIIKLIDNGINLEMELVNLLNIKNDSKLEIFIKGIVIDYTNNGIIIKSNSKNKDSKEVEIQKESNLNIAVNNLDDSYGRIIILNNNNLIFIIN